MIKKLIVSVGVIVALLALVFVSGGSGYFLKSKAKDQVLADFEKTLGIEFDQVVKSNTPRRADFIKFVINHSHLEVTAIKEIKSDDHLVRIQLHTISGEARHTLLAVLAPLSGRAASSFNFANAVSLIHQQNPELKIEVDQTVDIEVF